MTNSVDSLCLPASEIEAELPEGWTSVPLMELCSLIRGVSYKKGEESSQPKRGSIPLLRANNVGAEINFDDLRFVPSGHVSEEQRLRRGDVVIAMSSGSKSVVGKAAMLRRSWEGTFGAFCGALRPHPVLDCRYFGYFFQTRKYRDRISESSVGVNINNLKRKYFEQLCFPLAPLAEQDRIAAKIEELSSQINAARGRLARVPSILKRFRQAVLAAACSGRLTADWRESHAEIESARALLRQIESLRRGNVESISVIESPMLEDVPNTWCWVRLGSVIGELRNGISTKPEQQGPGRPILRISSVRSGAVLLDDVRFLPDSDQLIEAYALRDHDLLFTRYNGSLDLLGVCGMVRDIGKRILLYPDKLMRVRIDHPFLLPAYVQIFFQSSGARNRMTDKSKSSAGQQGISGADVKAQAIALPPVEEQIEIVRRVEALFKLANVIEKRVGAATVRAEKLTQAILAKAFCGELVPTEAELARRERRSYQPASELLARIQAARQQDEAPKQKKRAPARAKRA